MTFKASLLSNYEWNVSKYNISSFIHFASICSSKLFLVSQILTNSLQLSPSEFASCSAAQKFSTILWNLETHRRVHNSPKLFSILSHIDQVHKTPYFFPNSRFDIILLFNSFNICIDNGSGSPDVYFLAEHYPQ